MIKCNFIRLSYFGKHKLPFIREMMKFTGLLFLLISGMLRAQSFTLPEQEKTYYDVVEWKGVGALVLSKIPTEPRAQVKVTMVQGEGKSTWEQVFNPMVEEVYYIAEEGGKYVYFLESLEPKSGKIFFHQVSIAGNVKSTNTVFKPALDKLGKYNLEDMTVVDILNTDKSLVYLFRHENKEKKTYSTIAVSMTHHNFLCYATLISENVAASSKIEDMVSWYVAGENAENIVYAARTHASKGSGWNVKEVSPKGVEVNTFTISNNGLNFMEHSRVGFGRRGSALLNRVEPLEKGTLIYANGRYYVSGIELNGTNASLTTYVWENDKWNKVASSPLKNYQAKKGISMGYMPTKEGIGLFVKQQVGEGHFHYFNNTEGTIGSNIQQQTSNPSRMLNVENPANFVVALTDKWLWLDRKQFPVKGILNLAYTQR